MIFSEFLSQFVVIRNSSSKQLNPGLDRNNSKLGLFGHNRETSDLTKSRVKSLLSEWIIRREQWLWLRLWLNYLFPHLFFYGGSEQILSQGQELFDSKDLELFIFNEII